MGFDILTLYFLMTLGLELRVCISWARALSLEPCLQPSLYFLYFEKAQSKKSIFVGYKMEQTGQFAC
jgi:hypothetical protein